MNRCPDCGAASPADIHTCSPQKPICAACETVAHCMQHGCIPKRPAIEAAEKQEPDYKDLFEQMCQLYDVLVEELKAAQRAPVQEPIGRFTGKFWTDDAHNRMLCEVVCDVIPTAGATLYTTPPAAQPAVPLTDEQRRAIIAELSEADYADGDEWDNALFDAIEAAHGITAQASEKGQP